MRRRWRFALRELTLDLGPRLGSWRLSVVLMLVAALYYLFLAVWARSSPPHVVQNIAGLLPFWLVYALLLVNTAVCLWRRLGTLRREIGRQPLYREREPSWELAVDRGVEADGIRRALARSGFRLAGGADRTVGIRGRWAALGTYLFHGAFFLVALGFLATLGARQEARVWVAAGETFEGREDQFLSRSTPRLLASGLSPAPFTVESIHPEFWGDLLLFTELRADLAFANGGRGRTRINRPLWLGGSTFLRLSGFGYTLRYELLDEFGHPLDSAFVKLNVFPPGQEDYFNLPDLPHRVYVQVFPDFAVEGGEPMTRSLNLAAPAVAARVLRGRLDLGNAVLTPSDGFGFESLTLRFPEIRYWGEFSVVRDPGAPVLFLGYFLGLAGLLLNVRGRRREVEWTRSAAGEHRLRGWGGATPGRLERLAHGEERS